MSNVVLLDDTKSLSALASDTSNGLGILNVARCVVTEELNGMYECEFDIPSEDKHYSEIHAEGLFKVKPSETQTEQIFRIYHISKPMNGIVTVSGRHITYDLNKAAVKPCSATGASAAINAVKNNVLGTYPFTVYTNLTNTSSKFQITEPRSFRACLGGSEGSLLDVFGGEYEWNNLQVRLLSHRGNDNGVTIEYGKNLTDVKQEENIENTYNAVLGYATVNETTTTGTLQYAVQTSSPKTLIVDFTNEFGPEETPTVARLNTLAQQYIQSNKIGVPNVNITVSFAPLWQTEEYKRIATLERVSLGDTVHVKFTKLGVEATAKVIKTVYNTILERYDSIELGSVKSSLSQTLLNIEQANKGISNQLRNKVSASFMDAAIENATNLITGGLGGYVVISKNAAGEPEEILIMNTADKATATQVIRINKNGIGFGTSYNGPFETAWTIDGKFVADYIASGTINAIDIVGSLIKGATIVFGTDSTKTVTASGDSDGVSYTGDGSVNFETVGSFHAKNRYSSGKLANQLSLEQGTDRVYAYLGNRDSSGAQANYLSLNRYQTSLYNRVTLRNSLFADSSKIANQIEMYSRPSGTSSAEGNFVNFENYDKNGVKRNAFQMTAFATGAPVLALRNFSSDGSTRCAEVYLTATGVNINAGANNEAYLNVYAEGNVGIKTDGRAFTLKWISYDNHLLLGAY